MNKNRRHHNNKGLRQIKSDKPHRQAEAMARRLGVDNEGQGSQEDKASQQA